MEGVEPAVPGGLFDGEFSRPPGRRAPPFGVLISPGKIGLDHMVGTAGGTVRGPSGVGESIPTGR